MMKMLLNSINYNKKNQQQKHRRGKIRKAHTYTQDTRILNEMICVEIVLGLNG